MPHMNLLDTIKLRSRNRTWNPWTRNVPYTSHSLRDAETPPASHSASFMPESPIAQVHNPNESRSPSSSPSFFHSRQELQSLLSSPRACSSLRLISANSTHSHPTSVPAAAMQKSQEPSCNGPHNLCDGMVEPTGSIAGGPPNIRHDFTHSAFHGGQSSDKGNLAQLAGASQGSNFESQEESVDDLSRDIDIIVEHGSYQRTYRYKMLIDSGNSHANLISSRVVDELCLPRTRRKPSFAKRVLNKLAPWTNAGMAAKEEARGQIRNIDGTVIDGQDGTVTISWFGNNRDCSSDPIVWFQPKRYETTHIVVDDNSCGADIILSWKELKPLKLRQRFTGAIQRPPTPKSDPGDKKYQDYERRRAENATARKGATDQKSRQGQPPGTGNSKRTAQ